MRCSSNPALGFGWGPGRNFQHTGPESIPEIWLMTSETALRKLRECVSSLKVVLAYARAEQPAAGHRALHRVCFPFSPFLALNEAKQNPSRMQETFYRISAAIQKSIPSFNCRLQNLPRGNPFCRSGHRCWLWISLRPDSAASPV